MVKERGIIFEQPYIFEVTVIWVKPDGQDQRSTLSVSAMWYDIAIPNFTIDFDPASTLLTADQNSLFYLEAINFDIDDIYSYDVQWSI